MTITNATFDSFQGEDVELDVIIYEEDDATPQNITGWTIEFVGRPTWSTTPSVTESTTAGTIVITNPTQGEITITISMEDSVNMTAADYLFIIKRTDSGSNAVLTSGIWTLLAP